MMSMRSHSVEGVKVRGWCEEYRVCQVKKIDIRRVEQQEEKRSIEEYWLGENPC